MAVQEHYFKKKTVIPLELGFVKAIMRQKEFEFYTSPPVFSWRRVDNGTICLANGLQISETDTSLLDMGCGYGVIGIVAAHLYPNLKVTMIDSSDRAVFLARKNVAYHNLRNQVNVLQGNLYEPVERKSGYAQRAVSNEPKALSPKPMAVVHEKFDVIVSNPPYSAGKEVVNQIIQHAPEHLNKGGSLQIVGRHTKGGRMYMGEMEKVFKTVEDGYKKSGFRVYVGRN